VSRLQEASYILGNLKIQVEYEKPLYKLMIKKYVNVFNNFQCRGG